MFLLDKILHPELNSFMHKTTKVQNLFASKDKQLTGGPSGRQPEAIFQLQGRERGTPSDGAPIYQGSFEEYHIPGI